MSSSPDGIAWPAGWSRARLVHAEQSEIFTLSQDETSAMFASIRAVLGEAGFQQVRAEMSANYHARLAASEASAVTTAPAALNGSTTPSVLTAEVMIPFLSVLRHLRLSDEGEWGWVAFRTAPVHASAEQEAELFRRIDAEITAAFDLAASTPAAGAQEKTRAAQKRFRIEWIAEPGLVGASEADVARRYREMLRQAGGRVSSGMAHAACVVLDAACVRSIMEAEIPRSRPQHEQRVVAFVRAVATVLGADGAAGTVLDGERLSFNVEVRALVNEFFSAFADGSREVGSVGASVREGQVWSSSAGRNGMFTPS